MASPEVHGGGDGPLVRPVDATSAADVAGWLAVAEAARERDRPDEPPRTVDQVAGELEAAGLASTWRRWLAWDGDVAVGAAGVRLFTDPGRRHLGELQVSVRPDRRRQGLGSALVAAAAAAARAEERRSLLAEAQDTGAFAFLEHRGFRCVLAVTRLRLELAAVDREALTRARREPLGYRLVRWKGTVPAALADTFAAAKQAMADMPTGEMDYGLVHWDADRVREMARAVTARGDLLLTVAVLDAGGAVAGFTELVLPARHHCGALQYDTAVVPSHRGHRLGLAVKAEMLMWLLDEHPGVHHIDTDTADDNAHMLTVNRALGFRWTGVTREYQLDLSSPPE